MRVRQRRCDNSSVCARSLLLVGLWLSVWSVGVTAGLDALGAQQRPTQQSAQDRVMNLIQAGDLSGATTELLAAIAASPSDPILPAQLGSVLGLQGRLSEASKYFEKALALDPDDSLTRRNLGANEWQLGRLESARKNLEKVLQAAPQDKQAILLLGMVAENQKDFVRCAELLHSVQELAAQRPESIAALARCYYGTHQPERAHTTLAKLERSSASAEGLVLCARIALEWDDHRTAEDLLLKIQPVDPQPGIAGLLLAQAQFEGGRFVAAEQTLRALVNAGDRRSEVYNLLAWSFERQEKVKDAAQAMDAAIAAEPDREENYLDLALMLHAHQVYDVALEAAKRAAEVAPKSLEAYRIKAIVETKVHGNFDEADSTYQLALAKLPDSPDAVREYALAQWEYGLDSEAMKTFEKGIDRFPRDALLRQDYGRMLLRGRADDGERKARAVAKLREALALDDSLSEAHHELGKIALAEDNFSEAARHLEAAARLSPRDSRIRYSLLRAYRGLGRSDDVDRELKLFQTLRAEEENARPGPRRKL